MDRSAQQVEGGVRIVPTIVKLLKNGKWCHFVTDLTLLCNCFTQNPKYMQKICVYLHFNINASTKSEFPNLLIR